MSATNGVETAALMSLYLFQDRVVDGAVDMVDIYLVMRCCLSPPSFFSICPLSLKDISKYCHVYIQSSFARISY